MSKISIKITDEETKVTTEVALEKRYFDEQRPDVLAVAYQRLLQEFCILSNHTEEYQVTLTRK